MMLQRANLGIGNSLQFFFFLITVLRSRLHGLSALINFSDMICRLSSCNQIHSFGLKLQRGRYGQVVRPWITLFTLLTLFPGLGSRRGKNCAESPLY